MWLSPIYPSPGLDLGYDVADHSAIDPLFGTLEDFDRLVADAHRRGLKVLLDLVLNHTSDRHRWFEDSRTSRTADHADWYLWRDPAGWRRGKPIPPNNWLSFFGGPGWTWEPRRGQFYFHTFLAEQPDVNWRKPAVREAQLDVVRGWLGRDVDGFRLDVFNTFFKDPDLASNPRRPFRLGALRAWSRQTHVNDRDQPELGGLLAELRAIVDERPGRMTVGELFDDRIDVAAEYATPRHLIFDFGLLQQPWRTDRIAAAIDRIEAAFGPGRWPAVVLSNHDQPRTASRLARGLRGADRDAVAKAAAVLLLTLRGTPFLYYGEELGLGDVKIPRAEIVDPPARRYWPLPIWWNRDQCRSPMPWRPGPNAGFTTSRPWLRLGPDAQTRNVALEAADPASVLAAWRRLIALRKTVPALQVGAFRWISRTPDMLVYARETAVASEAAVVAINFRGRPAEVPMDGWPGGRDGWAVAWSTTGAGAVGAAGLRLAPYEAAILRPSG